SGPAARWPEWRWARANGTATRCGRSSSDSSRIPRLTGERNDAARHRVRRRILPSEGTPPDRGTDMLEYDRRRILKGTAASFVVAGIAGAARMAAAQAGRGPSPGPPDPARRADHPQGLSQARRFLLGLLRGRRQDADGAHRLSA